MRAAEKLMRHPDYGRLTELVGADMAQQIRYVVEKASRMDQQLDILHGAIDDVQNNMCSIFNDPVYDRLEQALQEVAQV